MKTGPVRLSSEEQQIVGEAFLEKLQAMVVFMHRFACGPTHTHFLYESVAADAVKEIGRAKQYASLRLKTRTGRIWAKGAKIIEVCDARHEANVRAYIKDHVDEGAWLWISPHEYPLFGSRL